jgi:hypothetical protein
MWIYMSAILPPPTFSDYDCISDSSDTSDESCDISQSETSYIGINGFESGNYTLTTSSSTGSVPIAGTWSVSENVDGTECGEGNYIDSYDASVSVTGSRAIVSAGNITRAGTISSNSLTFSTNYPEEGGVTTTSGNITFQGATMSGSSTWSFTDGTDSCSGTSQISGSKN